MINYIWMSFIVVGVGVSIFTGNVQKVTDASIEYSKLSVELAFGLIGTIALWSGLMRVAEEAGLVKALGKALKPIMTRLFPDVPADHPAMGSMVANIAANMFGLGNAATPLGLQAMKDLQTLTDDKETATNAMVMFLAINTSSVTLISSSILAMRVAANSKTPTEMIGVTLLATTISTLVAIIATRCYQKMKIFNR
ncbi:MAG: nucleoside recognition domain-containing protein [Brevinema sp.]